MKSILLILTSLLALSTTAKAGQEDFNNLLASIQDTDWVGRFSFDTVIRVDCKGPIKVHFFPMQQESFSGGHETVSYRHDALFTENKDALCQLVAKKFSVVGVGNCANFPMKFNPEENAQVPFRTIIPSDDGTEAVVNSPACLFGKVKREEFQLTDAVLSPDGSSLSLKILIKLGPLKVNVSYDLQKSSANVFGPGSAPLK